MDLISAFKSETFRPLATVFLPGAAAIVPYVLLAGHYIAAVDQFGRTNTGLYVTLLVLAALSVGFVLEDLGSRIEAVVWDVLVEKETGCHSKDWWQFLYLAPDTERIGHRYLRTITLRLKFELSFGLAIIALWFGLLWLDSVEFIWTYNGVILLSAVALSLASYLLWESYGSVWLLARLRHLIVNGKPCRMETRPEDPVRPRKAYDGVVLGSSILTAIWSLVLMVEAFASDREIGRDSGFMSGLLFSAFAVSLLFSWWWLRTESDAAGRRRGLCLRLSLAFALLTAFLYVRQLAAQPPLTYWSIAISILAATIQYYFARRFWVGATALPQPKPEVPPTLPDAA